MDVWSVLHTKILESFHNSRNTMESMYDTTSAASFRAFEKVSAVQRAVFENASEVIVRVGERVC